MSDSTTSPCSVYIIQDAHGAVKIGIAADAEARLKDLQTANSRPLALVYNLKFDNRQIAQQIERILHKRFASDALSGEWFSIDVERLIHDIEFAVEVGRAIQGVHIEYAAPPKRKRAAKSNIAMRDKPAPVRLHAAQLDEVAKWAIQRGYLSFSDLINSFQFDRRTANAVLYTFNKFGCLVPLEGQPGYYRYDIEWKSKQGVHA